MAVATPTRPVSRSPASSPRPVKRPGHGRAAALFLSPWVLGALLLTLGPMVASLYLSFTDYNLFESPEWVGLDNYVELFTDDSRFWTSTGVTAQYVLLSVPLKLGLALAVALLLNRPRAGQGFYRSAFYAPSLLGASVSVAIVWRVLFDNDGAADRVMSVFGIEVGGLATRPETAMLTIVLLGVWQFGAPMVIFLAGLKQIPQELYDAAAVDGAGRWRTFVSVTLPMLSPVLFFNLVLEVIHSFQSFTGAYVVSGGTGGPADSTLFYTLYLYQKGFLDFRMGYASAMAWLLLVAIAVITVLMFRSSRLWVFYAAGDNK